MRIANLIITKTFVVLVFYSQSAVIPSVNSGEADHPKMDRKVDKQIETTIVELEHITVEIRRLREKRKLLNEKLQHLRKIPNLEAESNYFRERLKEALERVDNIGVR